MEIKIDCTQSQSKDELRKSIPLTNIKTKNQQQLTIKESLIPKNSYISNGYALQNFFSRYVCSEYVLAGAVSINLLLIIIYVSINLRQFEMSLLQNKLKIWLLYMSFILQFFCLFALIINYFTFNQFKIHQNHQHEMKKLPQILIYSIILFIKPYPFLEDYSLSFKNQIFIETHRVNDLLCILSFLEIFLIFPALFLKSKFQNLRSNRLSKLYGFKVSYIYTMRCWFKQNSAFSIGIVFIIWFILCALTTRMAEYSNNQQFKYFENTVWLTFITMSTVGMGDIKPVTNIGFIINTITMYSGAIILSVAVMLLRNVFQLNSRQKRTLAILYSLEEKHQIRLVALSYIRQSLWRLWRNKKFRQYNIIQYPTLKERKLREQFQNLKCKPKRYKFKTSINEQLQHNFTKICGYLQNLNQNKNAIVQYLHQRR